MPPHQVQQKANRPRPGRSPLLGEMAGGVLVDGLTISATFIGSLVLAGFAIALIGTGRGLLKPE